MEESHLREEILLKVPPIFPRKKPLTRFIWSVMGIITLFFALIGLGELASMGVFGDSWQAGSTGVFLKGLAFAAKPFHLTANLSGVIGVAVLSISCLWFAFEFFHNSISQEAFFDSLPWRQREVRMRLEEPVLARTFAALSLNSEDPLDRVRLGVNPIGLLAFALEFIRLKLLSLIDKVSSDPQKKGVIVLKGLLSGLFIPFRPLKGIFACIDLLPRLLYGTWRFLRSLIPPASLIEGGGLDQSLAIAYDPLSQAAGAEGPFAPAAKGGYRLIHAFRTVEEGAEEKQGEKEETPPLTLTEARLREMYGFSYEHLKDSEGGRSYHDTKGREVCLAKIKVGKYQAIYGGEHLSDLEVANLKRQIAEERKAQREYRQELVRDAKIFRQQQAATEAATAALQQQLADQKAESEQALEVERRARAEELARQRIESEQTTKVAVEESEKRMEERFLRMLRRQELQEQPQNTALHENIPLPIAVDGADEVSSRPVVQPTEEKEPMPGTPSARVVSAFTFLPPPSDDASPHAIAPAPQPIVESIPAMPACLRTRSSASNSFGEEKKAPPTPTAQVAVDSNGNNPFAFLPASLAPVAETDQSLSHVATEVAAAPIVLDSTPEFSPT